MLLFSTSYAVAMRCWKEGGNCFDPMRILSTLLLLKLLHGCEAWLSFAPRALQAELHDGGDRSRAMVRPCSRLSTIRAPVASMQKDRGDAPWTRRAALAGAMIAPVVIPSAAPCSATNGYVKLGKGDKGSLVVPEMGVGAWSWGDADTWGFGTSSGASEASIQQAFEACVSNGITLVDTAEIYGDGISETILGKLLAATKEPTRSKIQVATKFYPYDPKSGGAMARTAKELLPALDASLQRLQMQSVDLYQIHGPGLESDGKEIGLALAEAVKSGRCKAVGVSNFALSEMMPVYDALEKQGIPLASNQIEFSLLRQLPLSSGLVTACRDLGVGILAYSPLAMGRLTGKYDSKKKKAPSGRSFGRSPAGTLDPLLAKMREIGARHGGKTPAQVALNWLVCQDGVVPIPGAKNAQQARDNAGAVGWRMTADEIQQLAALGYKGRTSGWQHDGA
jgi:aryl-alcohol dehydrogenase-like predicted oxidoreductase